MKYEIEDYKGQSIVYNDDSDKFECEISIEDNAKKTARRSLNDVRKEIDAFVKVNIEFKPFEVFMAPTGKWDDFRHYFVTAIRTDGKFMAHTKGNQTYKSLHGKKEYSRYLTCDQSVIDEVNILEKEKSEAIDNYKKRIANAYSKLKPMDLSRYAPLLNQGEKESEA